MNLILAAYEQMQEIHKHIQEFLEFVRSELNDYHELDEWCSQNRSK